MLRIQSVERTQEGDFMSELVHESDSRIAVRLYAPSLIELKILTVKATTLCGMPANWRDDFANVEQIDELFNRMSRECPAAEDLPEGDTLAYRATA